MPVRGHLRSLLRPAFQTYDRAIGTVSAIFGVLSVLLTLVVGQVPPSVVPTFIVTRDLLILFALIALCLFLLYRYAHREATVRAQLAFLSNQFRNFHSVVHHFRSQLFGQYYALGQHSDLTEGEISVFMSLCDYVTEGVKATFADYFNSQGLDIRDDDLCVTVKLIAPSSSILRGSPELLEGVPKELREKKSRWVFTASRDYHTRIYYPERERRTRLYDVESNTAFHHIVNMKRDCYFSNDLRGQESNYRNENPEWQKQYNATVVVPIRYLGDGVRPYECYGLLSVDSLNEKRQALFNEKECKLILGHSADLLAVFFLVSKVVPGTPPPPPAPDGASSGEASE